MRRSSPIAIPGYCDAPIAEPLFASGKAGEVSPYSCSPPTASAANVGFHLEAELQRLRFEAIGAAVILKNLQSSSPPSEPFPRPLHFTSLR